MFGKRAWNDALGFPMGERIKFICQYPEGRSRGQRGRVVCLTLGEYPHRLMWSARGWIFILTRTICKLKSSYELENLYANKNHLLSSCGYAINLHDLCFRFFISFAINHFITEPANYFKLMVLMSTTFIG